MGKSTSRRTDEARCRRILAIAQHIRGDPHSIMKVPRSVAARLWAFRERTKEYRHRNEHEGVAMSHDEAVELIKSYPKLVGNSKEWNVAVMVADCIDLCNGQWDMSKVEVLLRTWQDPNEDLWDRYLAQGALDCIPAVRASQLQEASGPITAVGIAQQFPDKRVSRPRGRYHAGANSLRNMVIDYVLPQLEGCGLPMHQHRPPSSMDGTGYEIRNNDDGTWSVLDTIGGDVRGPYDSEAAAKSALREFAENECPPKSIIAACAKVFGLEYKAMEKVWNEGPN